MSWTKLCKIAFRDSVLGMRAWIISAVLFGCGGVSAPSQRSTPAPAAEAPSEPSTGGERSSRVCPAVDTAPDSVLNADTPENRLAWTALEGGLQSEDIHVVEATLGELRAQAETHPNHALTAYAEGRLLSRLEDSEGAIRAYERAIRAHPGFGSALYNLGVVLVGLGRAQDATDAFQRALAVEPGNVDAWYNLAQVHYLAQNFDDALYEWGCALILEPRDFGIQKKIVQAHHALGDFAAALALRQELRAQWQAGQAPEGTRSMVIDQLLVGEERVFVQENLIQDPEMDYVYVFACTVAGQTVRTVQLESSAVLRELGQDSVMGMDADGTHTTFRVGFRQRPSYQELRPVARQLIEQIQAGSAEVGASSSRTP